MTEPQTWLVRKFAAKSLFLRKLCKYKHVSIGLLSPVPLGKQMRVKVNERWVRAAPAAAGVAPRWASNPAPGSSSRPLLGQVHVSTTQEHPGRPKCSRNQSGLVRPAKSISGLTTHADWPQGINSNISGYLRWKKNEKGSSPHKVSSVTWQWNTNVKGTSYKINTAEV